MGEITEKRYIGNRLVGFYQKDGKIMPMRGKPTITVEQLMSNLVLAGESPILLFQGDEVKVAEFVDVVTVR